VSFIIGVKDEICLLLLILHTTTSEKYYTRLAIA